MPRWLDISSSDNPQIKLLRQLLAASKHRHEHKKAVLEGLHLCQAAAQNKVPVITTLVARCAQLNPDVLALVQPLNKVLLVDDKLFRSLSQLDQSESLLQIISFAPESNLVETGNTWVGDAVYFDGIQDPGNMGTLLRTCAAAGINRVYLSKDCADIWSPKVLRSAMGGHFSLGIMSDLSIDTVLLQRPPLVVATALRSSNRLHQTDLRAGTLWCFGNEGQGLRPATLQQLEQYSKSGAYVQVSIDQTTQVESLNVAAATAVCLFEQRRQRAS